MRFLILGLLILSIPAAAFAQVKGQILSIGFNNHIRPDCWTPMLVQLSSQSAESVDYQIQIAQEDLDRDEVIYPQHVALGGTLEGHAATTENFWVDLRLRPSNDGLPYNGMGLTLNDLNKALKVYLCTKDGKQISVIPNTATIDNIDPKRGMGETSRSTKMVLVVSDGVDKPEIPFDERLKLRGVMEDADVEKVQPRDLPSNVIGYDAVDVIVWMDADANYLTSGTRTPALEALRQYVREGGHLVVCQPAEAFKVKPFADLLPIASSVPGDWNIEMVDCKDDRPTYGQGPFDILRNLLTDYSPAKDTSAKWATIPGAFKVARAIPTGDAKVMEWMAWRGPTSTFYTPWLARRGVGLGAVTWVAQDLGNPELTDKTRTGWRFVWDRVFDWNNERVIPAETNDFQHDPWIPSGGIDLGKPMLNGMDLTNKATYLVSLACLFFVGYWLAAGPGLYFFLVVRKKAHLSWFYFALAALLATGLTILVVQLVVRGPPELRHISVISDAAGDSTGVIRSRFGLYIPQDGPEQIEVDGTAPHSVSYIAPFGINPQYVANSDSFPASLQYDIPIRDASDASPLIVTVPYRRTSKKFDVRWVGDIKNKIEVAGGSTIRLVPPPSNNSQAGLIDGTLVNHSGSDLTNVYFAFQESLPETEASASVTESDWVVYVPQWAKDTELRFKDFMTRENQINLDDPNKRHPGGDRPAFGRLRQGVDWDRYWAVQLNDKVANSMGSALPMLTLFDRLPPWQKLEDEKVDRYELYRRNARFMNLSPAVSAGQLVMVGMESANFNDSTNSPLPFPLKVSDSPVTGAGTTLLQFVFPIDRREMYRAPATQPVSDGNDAGK